MVIVAKWVIKIVDPLRLSRSHIHQGDFRSINVRLDPSRPRHIALLEATSFKASQEATHYVWHRLMAQESFMTLRRQEIIWLSATNYSLAPKAVRISSTAARIIWRLYLGIIPILKILVSLLLALFILCSPSVCMSHLSLSLGVSLSMSLSVSLSLKRAMNPWTKCWWRCCILW